MTELQRGFACGECHVETQAQSLTEMHRCCGTSPESQGLEREKLETSSTSAMLEYSRKATMMSRIQIHTLTSKRYALKCEHGLSIIRIWYSQSPLGSEIWDQISWSAKPWMTLSRSSSVEIFMR